MPPGPDPPLASRAFVYPLAPRIRRHGPRGYTDDGSYKPWLRDDFDYSCVYCLFREMWEPNGDDGFGVEHLVPTSVAGNGLTSYDALAYACCQCNASRKAKPLPLDPCGDLGRHLEVSTDGGVRGKTADGTALIGLCRLNRPNLTRFRQLLLDVLALLAADPGDEAAALGRRFLGYPDNLPDLAVLRPPEGNGRPEGIAGSALARRWRGELPATY
jgi:hypothetical protein